MFNLGSGLTVGLLVGVIVLAFTGPESRTPGTGNPDFWIKSGNDIYYNPVGSGNVGIGTTDPWFPLNVSSEGTQVSGNYYALAYLRSAAADKGIAVGYDTSGTIGIISPGGGTNQLAIWTHNGSAWGERIRIDSTGNVGIGTATPQSKLQVLGGPISSGALNIGSTVNIGSLRLYASTDNANRRNWEIKPESAQYGTLGFWVSSSNSTEAANGTQVVSISKEGNVGIGKTPGSYVLDVNGTVNATTFAKGGAAINAANGLVALNGSSQLPAVSGALLTNLPTSGDMSYANSRFKSGIATFSFSNVSSQAVTISGIGFTSKYIDVFQTYTDSQESSISIGFYDGATYSTTYMQYGYSNAASSINTSYFYNPMKLEHMRGVISNITSDAFTLTLTHYNQYNNIGNWSGTAYVRYKAYR